MEVLAETVREMNSTPFWSFSSLAVDRLPPKSHWPLFFRMGQWLTTMARNV